MYMEAREAAGMTQKEAAERLHIGIRTLRAYELGDVVPSPEIVLEMSRIYRRPDLTMRYCRGVCAIGRAYSYEVLDAVNIDLAHIVLKLSEELEEARAMLNKAMRLVINKQSRSDFTEQEWREFEQAMHEFLDAEHAVEVLKIALGRMTDVSGLVEAHNKKCRERGYVKKKAAV
ncbi:MAG: helix-turn-helix domain-containing protein [Thermoanaerobacter sp.]|nr:helix-turn-helix domain-containing protein [Thermoanaerobacter sp.]